MRPSRTSSVRHAAWNGSGRIMRAISREIHTVDGNRRPPPGPLRTRQCSHVCPGVRPCYRVEGREPSPLAQIHLNVVIPAVVHQVDPALWSPCPIYAHSIDLDTVHP
jgi:hypothetical protein